MLFKAQQIRSTSGKRVFSSPQYHEAESKEALAKLFNKPDLYSFIPLLEKPHAQQTAATLHHLFTGLYEAASNKGIELSGIFAAGQDSIVHDLFDHAEAIELYYLNGLTQDQAVSFPGVYQYELVKDRLGPLLLVHIEQVGMLPPLSVWCEMIAINTEQWIKGG
jgi:hypothetical protein